MNANQLLDAIGEVKDDYVVSAAESGNRRRARRISFKKPLAAAALIALMLMLVGCAAVVVLHLQDMKVGESTATKKYDQFGNRIEPTEVTVELVTPHALKDSPMQLATRQWQEFTDSYDPEHKLMADDNVHGIPDNYYYTYGCYTWEMVEKLDEIVQEHQLKLLDKYTVAQRYQKDVMYEILGIDGILRPGALADTEESSGLFYPNGNFESGLIFTLTGEDAAWAGSCFAKFYYAKKDTFQPLLSGVMVGDFEQWNYTAADGTDLLLVLEADGEGQIYAATGDATIFLSITPDTPGFYPRDESEIPSRQALEQMADLFDYQVSPQSFVLADVLPKMDAAEEAYQAQNVYVEPEYTSFGEYLYAQPNLERISYCLMDYDGDGTQDLLTSFGDDTIFAVVFLRDGLVEEYGLGLNKRLCQGGVLETYREDPFGSFACYEYFKAGDVDGKPSYHHDQLQFVEGVMYEKGAWHRYTTPSTPIDNPLVCSEEEAQAVRAQYKPLDMEWNSVLEYPMEDGSTLAQYIRVHDPQVTDEGRIRLYREFAQRSEYYTYYGLQDVNGDGKTDLLLGRSSDGPVLVATEDRGKIRWILSGEAYLSQDKVYYRIENHWGTDEAAFDEYENYAFYRIGDIRSTPVDYVRHNLSTDTWGHNPDGPELSEAEAQAILDQYPPQELNLKPISQW